jgi:hypothetical protein
VCIRVAKLLILQDATVGIGLAYSQGRIGNRLDEIESAPAASDP